MTDARLRVAMPHGVLSIDGLRLSLAPGESGMRSFGDTFQSRITAWVEDLKKEFDGDIQYAVGFKPPPDAATQIEHGTRGSCYAGRCYFGAPG